MLQQQMKEITNIFRRVYRIYAHAWFQHRDMFWRVEESTGLYIFFKTVCDEYGMIQPENYTIPPEAEGLPPAAEDDIQERPPPPVILRPESAKAASSEPAGNHIVSLGDTTKRHTRVPSNVTMPVSTVIQEEAEEEENTAQSESSLEDTKPVSLPEASSEALEEPELKPELEEQEVKQEISVEEVDAAESIKVEDANEDTEGATKEEPSVPSIARSNTVVPVDEIAAVEVDQTEVAKDDEDLDEVTVLLDESEVVPDVPEVKIEAAEPEETSEAAEATAAAADGDEAGKSVKD